MNWIAINPKDIPEFEQGASILFRYLGWNGKKTFYELAHYEQNIDMFVISGDGFCKDRTEYIKNHGCTHYCIITDVQ